ncbi:hypothetical protein [Sphingomonas sp. LHG3443-2]|uniref:hypothetical protein n=1 Tax=Sphingomonas sp. LHG3443-2 TaxID=2804639 RepID=UPI003CEFDDED
MADRKGGRRSGRTFPRILVVVAGILFIANAWWSYELLFSWWPRKGRPFPIATFYWRLRNPLLLALIAAITVVAILVDGSSELTGLLTS